MVFLNGVHFGHIQTEMLLIHISRTFLESLGIGKWSFFDGHDVIQFLVILSSVSFIVIACICANLLYQVQGSTHHWCSTRNRKIQKFQDRENFENSSRIALKQISHQQNCEPRGCIVFFWKVFFRPKCDVSAPQAQRRGGFWWVGVIACDLSDGGSLRSRQLRLNYELYVFWS